MEPSDLPKTTVTNTDQESKVRPALALGMEDVGDLDLVLRGYYISQIKRLEKRKDRKLARRLLEDHLILPKSRQRTSKDAAYIKEMLEIEPALLEQLQESRLIRRINKRGVNPIYEISHDTLVEPILAEKRDREAIIRFLKKSWIYLALLLLLWFLFGMLFENSFEVLPDPVYNPKSIDIVMDEQTIDVSTRSKLLLPLPPLVMNQVLKPSDSIFIRLPINPVRLSSLRGNENDDADTIAIKLAGPLEIPLKTNDSTATYRAFSNVIVPLAYTNNGVESSDPNIIYANLSGNVKMNPGLSEKGIPDAYNNTPSQAIEIELGDTLVQAGKSLQSVPLFFNVRLTDLFTDEAEKNSIRNTVGDRLINLNYTVQVDPSEFDPPPAKIEYPSVQGIEVQYSDGTSRFIPGGDEASGARENEKIHIVASGETLFSIAKKYGLVDQQGNTSTKVIRQMNGLNNNQISVGQALRIPLR